MTIGVLYLRIHEFHECLEIEAFQLLVQPIEGLEASF